ncbi:hypothetical protein OG792_20170 [Micromonospora sp. NBC_01699]|uniref:hypothetical protein n=1 Tax=Micromonospora sp. NBC_01699 TaxID=2975984 RepID=UPI002E2DE2C5|nr:hypothetical protein [Micromonospora sp. NBC_01699]
MNSTLMVPVHLDALHCPSDRVVVRSTADYSRLPYFDGTRDQNSDVAQISEEIVGRPFQDETAVLQAGVHLHWALPDALTRGRQRPDQPAGTVAFPAVPNRWLVRRGATATLSGRAWVVESDYLHPDGTGDTAGVAVPYPPAPAQGRHRPFRYLGRAVPFELWRAADPTAAYVDTLTAVGFAMNDGTGYSDPTFAALYPNCHSVFGLHDPEVTDTRGLRYDLIGWYDDPARDFLRTVTGTVEEYAGWTPTDDVAVTRTVCYASCGFRASAPTTAAGPTTITIGNTATEALSVALAQSLDGGRRYQVEDQLEAILLAGRTEQRQVDVDAKFREARHEKGFTARRGGRLWTIVAGSTSTDPVPADASGAQARIAVPLSVAPRIAGLLAALNDAQQVRDEAAAELESLRTQLFADWYRYQLCLYPPVDDPETYPDIDEVRSFLEDKSLARVTELVAALRPDGDTPESRLRVAYAATSAALDALNATDELDDAGTRYTLAPTQAARYWQPTEPVVHLVCADARLSDRHGQDGALACPTVPEQTVLDVIAGAPKAFDVLLNILRDPDSFAFDDSDGSPWHPFQLEWEVEMFPLRAGGNVHPEVDSYDTDFITANFTLDDTGPDLIATGPAQTLAGAAAVYSGSSLLTGHAGDRMRGVLAEYLNKTVLPDFYAATGTPPTDDPSTIVDQLLAWYPDKDGTDPVWVAVRAYALVTRMDCLAQSLGGFNDALLMHRTVRQLPIGDPLGFPEDRSFAGSVADAVGISNRSAPEPLDDFTPIRSGAMRLLRLRLVDTFGQTRDVDCDRVVPAESLTVPGNPDLVALPPRLSQPARVVFRWLAADHDGETNEHPDTGPVCGWLLPNHLDTSVMVYDNQGRALGYVDQLASWQPAPGGTGAATVADIANPHLRATVADLVGQGADFVDQFMDVLDRALENIEPEGVDQHVDLAVLIGRPIALVRALVDLEVLGLPAVHQGWNAFRGDLGRATRDSDGFTRVQFPVRFGAHEQLDDGMIGYWVEGDPTLRTPLAQSYPHPAIRTCADGPLDVRQAVDAAPGVVRMLLDPRGKVHVTSGIQPVKAIGIPPVHYAAAMSAIEMTFPCAPLLTDQGAVNLPLPVEPGYRWAWLSRTGGTWSEVSMAAAIDRDVFVAALAGRLWDHLADPHVGWLRPVPGTTGALRAVEVDERASALLDPPFRAMTDRVEAILAPLGDHLVQQPATLERLADTVATPAWNSLLDTGAGWLRPLPERAGQALITAPDGRPQPVLTGDLAGAEPLIESILDLGEERVGAASTTALPAAPQELRAGWLKLRHDN